MHTTMGTGEPPNETAAVDFWHCEKCGRLCTKLEMDGALGLTPRASACPCGGLKFSPTNLPWWGWVLPRVWIFALHRARGVA
jgi:hypothetical protein